jgi:hypothetical protein
MTQMTQMKNKKWRLRADWQRFVSGYPVRRHLTRVVGSS